MPRFRMSPLLLRWRIKSRYIWKGIRQWLASVSVLVEWGLPFGIGIAMAQWDEFGPALALSALAAIVLILRSLFWKGVTDRRTTTVTLKGLGAVGSLAFFLLCWLVVWTKKGDKPWSPTWDEYFIAARFVSPPFTYSPVPSRGYNKTPNKNGGQAVSRSYVSFDNVFRFPERKDPNGKLLEDQHFQVGHNLAFNVYFHASGPNPVEIKEIAGKCYREKTFASETQHAIIADFNNQLRKEHLTNITRSSNKSTTMMPGDENWFTAFAVTDSRDYYVIKKEDLDEFRAGTSVSFVIAQITYEDRGVVHHARRCLWLQPPADPPGIWHFCEGFNRSD
jgi:hypothetical protein